MSETEHKRGKLKSTGKTLGEYIKYGDIPDSYSNEKEYFDEYYYGRAYLINGLVYEFEEDNVDCDIEIFTASYNDDGYSYEIRYYNGGCSHSEAISKALSSINLGLD